MEPFKAWAGMIKQAGKYSGLALGSTFLYKNSVSSSSSDFLPIA